MLKNYQLLILMLFLILILLLALIFLIEVLISYHSFEHFLKILSLPRLSLFLLISK